MVKFDILDYGVYLNGNHIADFEGLCTATQFARDLTKNNRGSTVVICNFTGEIKFTADIVEVTTYRVKEWVAD